MESEHGETSSLIAIGRSLVLPCHNHRQYIAATGITIVHCFKYRFMRRHSFMTAHRTVGAFFVNIRRPLHFVSRNLHPLSGVRNQLKVCLSAASHTSVSKCHTTVNFAVLACTWIMCSTMFHNFLLDGPVSVRVWRCLIKYSDGQALKNCANL